MNVDRLVMATLLSGLAACGGSPKEATAPEPEAASADGSKSAAEPGSEPPDSSAASSSATSGSGGSASERPFAGSAAEATNLITEAVDKKQESLAKCVTAYRFRTHLAHEKVSVTFGIDQEGRLIGVTLPKGKEDKELTACVREELRDASFPRSHAGIITITRSFQEMVK